MAGVVVTVGCIEKGIEGAVLDGRIPDALYAQPLAADDRFDLGKDLGKSSAA